MTGRYHGGEGTEIAVAQPDRLLHDGGGGRREAADGPGGSVETDVSNRGRFGSSVATDCLNLAQVGHSGRLHDHPSASSRQTEAVRRSGGHVCARGQRTRPRRAPADAALVQGASLQSSLAA